MALPFRLSPFLWFILAILVFTSFSSESFLSEIILIIVALLPAITIHEFSHAWAAFKLGDPTAKMMGRLTLKPHKHLDLMGTLALIFFHFGWGKPVPVNPSNFKKPLRDQALVAFAGPASNLLSAAILFIPLKYFLSPTSLTFLILAKIAQVSIVLAIFNLLPLHPLDGSKILLALFPKHQAPLLRFYQNSPSILLGLLVADFILRSISGFSIFGMIFGTVIDFVNMIIFSAT